MERMTLLVTLMLTASTYSLVVARDLSTLGYLTLLDKYILCTFVFFGIVAVEIAGVDWFGNVETADDEFVSTYVNVGIWLVAHIGFGWHVRQIRIDHARGVAANLESRVDHTEVAKMAFQHWSRVA